MSERDTWGEYSRLVLKELETLASSIASLNGELQDIKREIALLKDREDKVKEIVAWKKDIGEVTSPSQLKDTIKDVEDLKQFKTKAITVFVVIEVLMGVGIALLNYWLRVK